MMNNNNDDSMPEFNSSLVYLSRLAMIQEACIERLVDPEESGHLYKPLLAFYSELFPRLNKEQRLIAKKLLETTNDYWNIYLHLNNFAHQNGLIMKDADDARLAFRRGKR